MNVLSKFDLSNNIHGQNEFNKFENIFEDPLNKKLVRANHKSHLNKTLRNAIDTRSRLRKISRL